MTEAETAEAIDDHATQWVARIDRHGLDDAARAELDAWLAGDPRREGAFLRAQAAWGMLDRASILATPGRSRVTMRDRARPSRRWALIGGGGAIAASMAGISTLGLMPNLSSARVGTARGEIRQLPLQDGSMLALNTQSAIDVQMRPSLRKVKLERGEAWFQVAKDPRRPFVVAAGDIRVRAVGTAFSVRRLEGGAEVQVTEGVVETWSVGVEGHRLQLTAGARAFVANAHGPLPAVEASTAIDRSLAWRSGQIVLDGDTLEEAAAEFNRYNQQQVVFDHSDLARERVVGRFRTNEPGAFARAVAETLGAQVEVAPDAIRLSRG